MKNILVPTNFSNNCIKAAQLGIAMAKLYNSEIHFLHLLKTPVDWVKLDKLKEDITDAFKKVIAIANKCDARIHLLQINTKTDFNSIESSLTNIDLLLKKFPDFENYSKAVYNEESVEVGINKFIEQQPVDLIAMVTHVKTGFLSLFSKSIVEGVTNHSTLPVMTLHI
ncbi:universal stress protein [Flavobacterium sp.]|jgi:nucleotide-binding universal stress UspA family protein|uniref:universal stress protein n=1 Tax=Flavobacterium sp. TaxID=239 RepID=UPI002A82D4D0|nr:universal stress protein [Flavobacterium sp.]